MQSFDLGQLPRRSLLTGAGFTKNWGGHLATELWPLLDSTPVVNGNPALRGIFRKHLGSFEDALTEARHAIPDGAVSAEEVAQLERDIVSIFMEQERTINAQRTPSRLNESMIQEMLSLFAQGPSTPPKLCQESDTGYIFTLNQDLLVERIAVDGHMYHQPVTPGVAPRTSPSELGRDDFRPDNDRHLRETRQVPNTPSMTLRGNLNYIKLHGSYEWRSADRPALVVGGMKEDTIGTFPVLQVYLDIFRQVCCSGGLKLMVCGYGFGDPHINQIIATGARDHELTVFLVDPRSPQQTKDALDRGGQDGAAIWSAITGWSTKPLRDTFPPPSGEHRSPEYWRILELFFDWNART
ncbi:MAG: SIR2 family protein [Proteobacteria bacterium]|nr:SIR2 family protein [Pseudomonadota bacterium]